MSKTTGFASSLLPDDDEQVQSMLSQRQQMEMNPADMLVALKTGETWPKCFAKHLEARAHLSSLLEREVAGRDCRDCNAICFCVGWGVWMLVSCWGKGGTNHQKSIILKPQVFLYLFVLDPYAGANA